jgi:hypothetical protein
MLTRDFKSAQDVRAYMAAFANAIRTDKLDLGRKHYALILSVGVMQAILCGVDRILAVEFGVGPGAGLLDLCRAAAHFRAELGIEIDIYGMDNATGLPPPRDYRDLPEIWSQGMFPLRDPNKLRSQLPPYAHLVIGDVAETAGMFEALLSRQRALGFVAVDVDFYSSAVPCLGVLQYAAEKYMPMVPMYFDDILPSHFTYSDWVGESLAIDEFNEANALRKISINPGFNIGWPTRRMHACHILDHPYRNGTARLRHGFGMMQFSAY